MRAANVFVHLFVVAGLGFLLPFVTLSCSGQRLATVTGVQLVTGAEAGSHRSPSDAQAAFALGMCVLGVLLSLRATGTAGRIPAALAGAAGTIALLFFKTTLEDEALRQGHGVIRVQYEFGYYLALVALASAAAAGFWEPGTGCITRGKCFKRRRRRAFQRPWNRRSSFPPEQIRNAGS